MKCMMCSEEKEMNAVYKGIVVCSESCRKDIESLGIERLIINKEDQLERLIPVLKALRNEKNCKGITFEGISYTRRAEKEINEDIEYVQKDVSTLENQINSLKKHNDVRLKYLL
ncbi:hypothetical protein BC2926_38800 [Bacillus cereus]|nr:hypothetical protein BC2926_38800 [Bacillus cereus]